MEIDCESCVIIDKNLYSNYSTEWLPVMINMNFNDYYGRHYGFIACFIGKKPYTVECLFNPECIPLESWDNYKQLYKRVSNFISSEFLEYNVILLTFEVLDRWKMDFNLYKDSKYSKISRELAERYSDGKTATKPYFVITKSPKYRAKLEEDLSNERSIVTIPEENELMDVLDPIKEYLNYSKNYNF